MLHVNARCVRGAVRSSTIANKCVSVPSRNLMVTYLRDVLYKLKSALQIADHCS